MALQAQQAPEQIPLIQKSKTPKEVFRHLRNFLAGQHLGATRDDALLEELLKCLFCKLYAEMDRVEEVDLTSDSFAIAKTVRGIFAQVREDFPDVYSKET